MADFFAGKPLHVITTHKTAEKRQVTVRWEHDDGSDTADIDRLIALDPDSFAKASPTDACNLVARLHQSQVYLQMTSQIAECDGKAVGYVLLTQVRVGERTHLLLVGCACDPAGPQETRSKLLSTVLHTARAGFYSALLAVCEPDALPGVKLNPVEEHGITPPSGIPAGRLLIGELIPDGIGTLGGTVTLDPAFEGWL